VAQTENDGIFRHEGQSVKTGAKWKIVSGVINIFRVAFDVSVTSCISVSVMWLQATLSA